MMNFGVLGFGEAGSAFTKVLASESASVLAYDKTWEESKSPVQHASKDCNVG